MAKETLGSPEREEDKDIMNGRQNIMIVDDNPDLVEIVKRILSAKGYGVQCVYGGEEVFQRLEEQRPDLILLDIMMPRMDGFDVLSRLRRSAETSAIPVILLTGRSQFEDVLKGYGMGTDYYISKPFTPTQLLNGIDLVLGNMRI